MTTTRPKIIRRTRLYLDGARNLAAELGVDRSHLYRVLHGYRKPGKELAAALESRGLLPKPRHTRKAATNATPEN